MKIFNYTFTNSYYHGMNNAFSPFTKCCFHNTIADTFEHSGDVSFTAKKTDVKKAVENNYKNIEGLHDPYSDVVLLTPNKKDKLYYKLEQTGSAESALNIMSKYTCYMFEPERNIYDKLIESYNALKEKDPKQARLITLSELLNDMLPEAKSNLVNHQLDILDTMRSLSRSKLSKESQRIVSDVFDNAVEAIYTDEFRTKKTLSQLLAVKDSIPEKREFAEIYALTDDLPRSATSSDVFVVKNHNKSDIEISLALVSPAEATIEHIRPQSNGGPSNLNNYIIASKRMNNIRSSLSLQEFIEKYPNIPSCTQRYMDDLISKVNAKDMKNIGISIPDVKAQLFSESKGLIDVDISALDTSHLRAAEQFNIDILNLHHHFTQN